MPLPQLVVQGNLCVCVCVCLCASVCVNMCVCVCVLPPSVSLSFSNTQTTAHLSYLLLCFNKINILSFQIILNFFPSFWCNPFFFIKWPFTYTMQFIAVTLTKPRQFFIRKLLCRFRAARASARTSRTQTVVFPNERASQRTPVLRGTVSSTSGTMLIR